MKKVMKIGGLGEQSIPFSLSVLLAKISMESRLPMLISTFLHFFICNYISGILGWTMSMDDKIALESMAQGDH